MRGSHQDCGAVLAHVLWPPHAVAPPKIVTKSRRLIDCPRRVAHKEMPKASMDRLNLVLARCGEAIAVFWLSIVGILVLLAFPVSGIVASFFVGALACELVRQGWFGVTLFFVVAFFFGLFLSIYVWEPHVKRIVFRISELVVEMGRE
jgi:hypothetical protein